VRVLTTADGGAIAADAGTDSMVPFELDIHCSPPPGSSYTRFQ
jgi:hypothetical protein